MVDEYVEVSDSPGCFARVKDSIAKLGIGIVMILISFPLLFWNEGRAVKRAEDLEFGRGAVESVDASKVADKDGALVHVSGDLTVTSPAKDPKFGVAEDAVALKRTVEMYQWEEKTDKEKRGDKTVTTYRYIETWSDREINSGSFQKSGYDNPSMPFESETFYSSGVKLGAYKVDKKLAAKWPVDQSRSVTKKEISSFPKARGSAPVLDSGNAYFGNPSSPTVGDVRVSFEVGPPGDATAIAGLTSGALSVYSHPDMNGTIAMLEEGTKSADVMFQAAEESNETMTWILRLVGFLLMFMGFNLLFGPLDTIVRMIPILGAVIDFGTTLLAGILAAAFSLITIAIGWIVYRPLVGLLLLAAGMGIIGLGIFLGLKARKSAAST